MDIRIEKVDSKKSLNDFIRFPHRLYADDPNYVPELNIVQKKFLDKNKNPFFTHSSVELLLAYKEKQICGRIALIRNGRHQEITGENNAFFGFFDVIDDFRVASVLLNAACEWARQNHFSGILGPVNFSTNDTCGLLVDGYTSPPVIMMTYHKSYHKDFLERFGFEKKTDLLAYYLSPDKLTEKYLTRHELLEDRLKKRGIVIRNLSLAHFKEDVDKINTIYNSAWESNWGFVPMTKEEFTFAAAELKSIVDPEFAYVAEYEGKAIGFSLAIPNLNEILIRIKGGKLFPTGIFKLLLLRKKIKSVRILTLGVIKEFRLSGLDACFYARNIKAAKRKNIQWAEASWILEGNTMMNRAMENIGAEVYKKYRIYQMAVS